LRATAYYVRAAPGFFIQSGQEYNPVEWKKFNWASRAGTEHAKKET
jgi:hypothetical protein